MGLQYVSGQGKIWLAERNTNGSPKAFRWVGDTDNAEFSFAPDYLEAKESFTGQRQTVVRIRKEVKSAFKMTLKQLQIENLRLLAQGENVTQDTTPVTAETLTGNTIAVGDMYKLGVNDGGFTVTAVTITDSTGSPKTLTADTNYRLNASTGMIEILDLTTGGAFVAPLKAAYTPGTQSFVKMMTAGELEYWMMFEGVNTAVSGNPAIMMDLYRVRLSPSTQFGLIHDELGTFPVEGSVLVDQTKSASSDLGQFGRIALLGGQ